jgi:hypothetical protein
LLNQSDYVLRLIEQMGGLVRRAKEKLHIVDAEEPYEVSGQAIGLALGIDPSLASRLSPQSLVSLLKLGSLDDRVEAGALQTGGNATAAEVRREQASAARSLLGPTHAD